MITQHWRVTIDPGSASGSGPRELQVDAGNWMAALRSARALIGEEGAVPAGAACTVEGNGTISIVVPTTRQRFRIETCPVDTQSHPPDPRPSPKVKRPRSQTIAYAPPTPSPLKKASISERALTAEKSVPSKPRSQDPVHLELLLSLDEAPTENNPLTYRERAYVMPEGCRVTAAETALREELRLLQATVENIERGKFVNLAVFDHAWTETPLHPPVIVLEWRDWRGEPVVDYPTRPRRTRTGEISQAPVNDSERLTHLFDELQELETKSTAVDASQLLLRCLLNVIPAAAGALYLYDINTDELRAVAKMPIADPERLPDPVPSSIGLLGQHLERETAISIDAPATTPHFDLTADGLGVEHPANILLRPIRSSSMLIGAIQLVNRAQPERGFTTGDCNIANYAADRLSETILQLRLKHPGS